jgi:hypothetical protein
MIDILEQLKQLDTNAEQLYTKLLKTVGVTFDRCNGEIVRDRAGLLLLGFGIPDLLSRLESQKTIESRRNNGVQDSVARARIWRHIAEASKPMPNPKQGEGSISDITDNCQLNAWLSDAEKFTAKMPPRKCTSCGLPYDMCENHFTKDGSQTDENTSWFCFWCFKDSAVREHFGVKESSVSHESAIAVFTGTDDEGRDIGHIEIRTVEPTRGACAICKLPWEGIGTGGHVPVKDSDTDWVCGHCVRNIPSLIVGSSVVLRKEDLPKKPRSFNCAWALCGSGRDERGNRVRGKVERRGDYCSKTCKQAAKLAQKDARKRTAVQAANSPVADIANIA